jgi:hypothetical protein
LENIDIKPELGFGTFSIKNRLKTAYSCIAEKDIPVAVKSYLRLSAWVSTLFFTIRLTLRGPASQTNVQESNRLNMHMAKGMAYPPDISRRRPDKKDPKAPPAPLPMLIMAKIRPNDLPIKISALTEGISGAAAPYPNPNNKANKRGKRPFVVAVFIKQNIPMAAVIPPTVLDLSRPNRSERAPNKILPKEPAMPNKPKYAAAVCRAAPESTIAEIECSSVPW